MKIIAAMLCALALAGCVHDDKVRAPDTYNHSPNGAM